jgi:hypothetical protein
VGPENRFIAAVHRLLPQVYHEKMHNPYRGGTFDVWYSGKAKDLWIEYKWIPRTPVRAQVIPALEPLQLKWGRERYEEGRDVFVVVGCPDGGVLFQRKAWEEGVSAEEFRRTLLTKFALAKWIFDFATGEKLDAHNRKAVVIGSGHGGGL